MSKSIQLVASLLALSGLLLAGIPAAALESAVSSALHDPAAPDGLTWYEVVPPYSPDALMARDSVDLEEHGGWTGEYVFGMTKGLMRSTLVPALKPVFLILTVPLDLVFLPFAAIGGFFR